MPRSTSPRQRTLPRLRLQAGACTWIFSVSCLSFLCGLSPFSPLTPLWAGVTSDGSLGPGSVLNAGGHFSIPVSAGLHRGANLFQSLSEFNLLTGQSATFETASGIQNVITRIHGGQSSVDGKIVCGANLFLLNPSGFVFGQNASIDITGSFTLSTADHLKMADGSVFSSFPVAGESDTLTSAAPSAFGFLTENSAAISLNGTKLTARDGAEISLVAGKVLLDSAQIAASSGQVSLAAAGAKGQVPLKASALPPDTGASKTLQGEVGLRNASRVDVSGGAGGRVVIRGGKLLMEGASKIVANQKGAGPGPAVEVRTLDSVDLGDGQILSHVQGSGPGGGVRVETGEFKAGGYTGGIYAENEGSGSGSNLTLKARSVSLDNAYLSTRTATDGASGNVHIEAEQISLTGNAGSGISAETASSAKGGDIVLKTGILVMDGLVYLNVNTSAAGDAGHIQVDADALQFKGYGGMYAVTHGAGNAGNITLNAPLIDARDFYIQTFSENAQGAAGAIRLSGQDIFLRSETPGNAATAGLSSSSFAGGRGGNIVITGRNVLVEGARIQARATGKAPGGNVSIQAESLRLEHSASIEVDASGEGSAGSVDILANRFAIAPGAVADALGGNIVTTTSGNGTGGNITIRAGEILVSGYGGLYAKTAAAGDAGQIRIRPGAVRVENGQARETAATGASLRLENGYIAGDVEAPATGHGGLVDIQADRIEVAGYGGGISVGTQGRGTGGEVVLSAPLISVDGPGLYIGGAVSGAGDGGVVRIRGCENLSVSNFGALFSSSSGAGAAGSIEVDATNLRLDQAYIAADCLGSGRGGSVVLRVPGKLFIGGSPASNAADAPRTGISVAAFAGSTGAAGRIDLSAGRLEILGNANSSSGINARSETSSSAGEIHIRAASARLERGASISSANVLSASFNRKGDAGSVHLEIGSVLDLSGASLISTASESGNAGVLSLHAGAAVYLRESSALLASAPTGRGGSISLQTSDWLELRNSTISAVASVQGGNVSIDPRFVVVDHSWISAQALGGGLAGNLSIEADYLFSNESSLFATGQLSVQSVDAQLANALEGFQMAFSLPSAQMQERCAFKYGGGVSSFFVGNRGGIERDPALPALDPAFWKRRR